MWTSIFEKFVNGYFCKFKMKNNCIKHKQNRIIPYCFLKRINSVLFFCTFQSSVLVTRQGLKISLELIYIYMYINKTMICDVQVGAAAGRLTCEKFFFTMITVHRSTRREWKENKFETNQRKILHEHHSTIKHRMKGSLPRHPVLVRNTI